MTTVEKIAKLRPSVRLQPHQQRVVDRVGNGSNGLLLYHGLGTGKSLAAIAAAEGTGDPYSIVAPASLRANFNKEMDKFTAGSDPEVKSYTELALGGKFKDRPETLIVDEAHRMRNPGTASSQAIQQLAKHAKRVLLLTGSPITNEPSDLAPLLSAVTGSEVSPGEFDARFVGKRRVAPSLLQRLAGVSHGEEPELINEDELRDLVRGHVDYQAGKRPDGVKVDEEIVRVPLSPDQRRIQDAIRTRIPPTTLWKLDRQFPLSEEELSRMNSFLSGLRQASLSTLPFRVDKDPATAYSQSEKIKSAVMTLRDTLRSDPRKKALVYSNFTDAGLATYAAGLDKAKIPHGIFHGGVSETQRQKALSDYNAGRIRALLIGPAGAEGISTKGTNLIQLLDPHWHESRLQQAQGRGLRFDSHDGLPDDLKNVKVQRYISSSAEPHWLRKLFGARRQLTGDELLEAMGARKEVLNEQFRKILKEEGTMKAAAKPLPEDSIAELSDDRLRYVVQHHQQLGNREHLDLRLGTPTTGLHSWAVPKAKMPEPGEKRLLVQTPVHDYSYGEFQGPLRSGKGMVRRQAYTDAKVMARTPHTLHIQADGREMTLLRSTGKDGKVKWYLLGHAPALAEKVAGDLHDWDGTLIPRLSGNAAEYRARLDKLTPADRPKLALPAGGVDIATARPPMFHAAILKAAKRLGIKVLSIKHATGDKVKEVGEAGGTITDDDPAIVDAVNAKYPGRGILMKAAEDTIKEKLRRLRERRGDCQECGVCLLDGCEHHKARTADEILPPVEKEAALAIEKKKRMVEETYQDCPQCGKEWGEKGGPWPKPGDEDIYVCPHCDAELEYPEMSDEEIAAVTPWLRDGLLKRRDARRKRKSEKQATVPHADDLETAEAQVEADPSPEKAKAGNYRKGHFRMHGLMITLETAKGQFRRGIDRKGKAWEVKMPASYGYVKRTVSEADEDHIDVFVGPKTSSRNVYVVDQVNGDGKFDEHKCMIGFDNQADAVATYKAAYTNIAPYGGCTPVTWEQFRWWIHNGDTSNPIAGQPLEAKRDGRTVVTKAAAIAWKPCHKCGGEMLPHDPDISEKHTLRGSVMCQSCRWSTVGNRWLIEPEKCAAGLPLLKVMASDGSEKVTVGLEFATTPTTRAAGLSHREKLADGTGMFFDTPGPFWMKDCTIPLDLTWLSRDGKVLKTAQMPVPASPRDLRLYYPPAGAVAALETNLGWAQKHAVLPGDTITLEPS